MTIPVILLSDMLENTTGEAWLQRVRTGDETPWTALYAKSLPSVRNLVRQGGGSPADADDLLQEALVVFYEQVMDGRLARLTCAPSTYLYSVARYMWLDRQQKAGRHPVQSLDAQPGIVLRADQWQPGEPEPELDLVLQQAIARLNEQCRRLIQLTVYEKTDLAEVARRLGYDNAHVASNSKYRCLERLKTIARELMSRP